MKKYFLQAMLLLTSIAAFAQDEEEHSAAYNFGYKNWPYILGGIALILILIFAFRKKKKP